MNNIVIVFKELSPREETDKKYTSVKEISVMMGEIWRLKGS